MGVCCGTSQQQIQAIEPSDSQAYTKSQTDVKKLSDDVRYENIRDYYDFIRIIGYGHFGTVRKAVRKHQRTLNLLQEFAVKSVSKKFLKKDQAILTSEISILKQVDHPNIVRLFEVFEDKKYIHFVMELCEGGDLLDNIIENQLLSEARVAQITRSILRAINHLHSHKIVHRDLKPDNFLFANSQDDSEVKLADFGLSVKFPNEGYLNTTVGTPFYLAPEVIHGLYSNKCDSWSIGVCIFLLLSGKQPFQGKDVNEVFGLIIRGRFSFDREWDNISVQAKDLISKLLVVNPDRRLSIEAALEHPWFEVFQDIKQPLNKSIIESLKQFHIPNKLYQEAMKLFVRNLTEDEIQDLKHAFYTLDINKTGMISLDDIAQAMHQNGLYLAKEDIISNLQSGLKKRFEYLDNGKITYTQFLVATLDKKKFIDEEALWEIFKQFDRDKDGKISKQDLQLVLEQAGCIVSEQDLRAIEQEFQLQTSNMIDFKEFKEIMYCFPEETPTDDSDGQNGRRSVRRLSQRRVTLRRSTLGYENRPISID